MRIPVHGHWLVRKSVGDILTEAEQFLLELLLLGGWGLAPVPQILEHGQDGDMESVYDLSVASAGLGSCSVPTIS